MDRRKSIKALIIGTAATGVMIDACKPEDKKAAADTKPASSEEEADRMKEEIAFNKKLNAEQFFTKEEMATITVLADIIIPKDAVSGSAR